MAAARALLLPALGLATLLVSGRIVTPAQSDAPRDVLVRGRRAVARDVLVKFRPSLKREDRDQIEAQLDADRSRSIGSAGVRLIRSKTYDSEVLLHFLETHPAVAFAEPNYLIQGTMVPSDPNFGQLWGLLNVAVPGADIGAASAWDISTGSASTVVAVVDSGIDDSHPDLAANLWTASQPFTVTLGSTAITCAAGTHGFNAIANTCDPRDDNGHGSHVAGTIGATGGNGVGVTGVNWTSSLMALKFLDANNLGTIANAINAIEFAIQARTAAGANIRVINNSWGGGPYLVRPGRRNRQGQCRRPALRGGGRQQRPKHRRLAVLPRGIRRAERRLGGGH